MQKLFVYGTLMSGMPGEHLMRNHPEKGLVCEMVSDDCYTDEKYAMYIHDDYPFVFEGRNSYRIKGELYNVSEALLKELDNFEGQFYVRRKVSIIHNGLKEESYIYCGRGHFAGMDEVGADYRVYRFNESE